MDKIANIIPLFWLKGEAEDILLDGLAKLREAGIFECILEARPFPHWLEKPWFDTLRTLFAEAKRTGMRLWLFDDGHFPSGGADGRISEAHRKLLLRCQCVKLPSCPGTYQLPLPVGEGESLFKAILAPEIAGNGFDGPRAREVFPVKTGQALSVSVPEAGAHCLFLLIRTREGGEEYTRNWVNMLSREAVQEFLDISYETHYRELKEYFENGVLAGFFSDEPRFGSAPSYDSLPNGNSRSLPFSEDLAAMLGNEPPSFWPSLWQEGQQGTESCRIRYMDAVSHCYAQAFPRQIGEWCHAHGVLYIGHTIEDNGAHTRVGYGTGHFFRTMTGQDIAAVDSVLHQNLPGATQGFHETSFGRYDSAFYHWGLAKLAASAAHLMSSFHGRAGCECFGANGWSCGLERMKELTDHFVARGINCFLPHAFSNAPFPDPDCPPHFYARGNNPQWPCFHLWREYCDRLCDRLQGGIHLAGTAVLYHAEAEWSTRPFTPFHTIGKELLQAQLDFDTVPFDLLETAQVHNGTMTINGEDFRLLAVPSCAWLPEDKRQLLQNLKQQGLAVLQVQETPALLQAAAACQPYPVSCDNRELRCYRYRVGDETRLFLVNEHLDQTATVTLPSGGAFWYDALTAQEYQWHDQCTLAPGESLFAVYRPGGNTGVSRPEFPQGAFQTLPGTSIRQDDKEPGLWHCHLPADALGRTLFLDCGRPEGVTEIQWNGQSLPPRFASPYRFTLPRCTCLENDFRMTVLPTVDPALGGIFDRAIPRRCNPLSAPRIVQLES